MFNNISWAGYLYVIFIIAVIYYAVILLVYYRNEIAKIFNKIKDRVSGDYNSTSFEMEQWAIDIMETAAEDGDQNAIQELLLNIQSVTKVSASKHFPKDELLSSIQLLLQVYSSLASTMLGNKINHFVKAVCLHYCSVHLSEEEVSALWIK
jgi:uncharacterized protein YbjQ (UPF0145 family)